MAPEASPADPNVRENPYAVAIRVLGREVAERRRVEKERRTREGEVRRRVEEEGRRLGLNEDVVRRLVGRVFDEENEDVQARTGGEPVKESLGDESLSVRVSLILQRTTNAILTGTNRIPLRSHRRL
jgi:hypothetical protein